MNDNARSLSNNSFLETKNATQYPAYSNLDFVVELLTSLHSPNYAYRLAYCLSDRLLGAISRPAKGRGHMNVIGNEAGGQVPLNP